MFTSATLLAAGLALVALPGYHAAALLPIGAGAWLIHRHVRALRGRLARAHACLDAILDNVPSGVILLDSEERIMLANRAAAGLFRHGDASLEGMHAGQLFSGPAGIAGTIRNGTQELSVRRAEGEACQLQVTASDVLPGLASGRILIVQDLTQRSAGKRLEQELRQNEKLLRDILDALPVGVWVADAGGRILMANPASAAIWGSEVPGKFCVQESGGRCHASWQTPPTAGGRPGFMPAPGDGDSLHPQIVTLDCFHGRRKTIRYSVLPLQQGDDGHAGAVLVSEDISVAREAELALRRSEASLANAQRLARIGNWERDIATGRQFWSDEMFRICDMEPGGTPPDFLSQLAFIPEEDRQRVRRLAEEASQGTKPYDITYQAILPSGARKVFHSLAQVERDGLGRIVRVRGTLQDISEKKQAEELLRKREQEFRALVEHSPDVIARFDRDLRCVYVNPALKRATGLRPEHLIGKALQDSPVFDAAATQWRAAISRVFGSAMRDSFEFAFTRAARVRHFQVMLVPEFRNDGMVASVLAMARDVSALKRDAEALRQSRQQLRDLSAHMEQVREEERKSVAREVHDELGQALTVLRMEVSLLRVHHGQDNAPLLERIESIKQGIDRTIHIVRHVSATLRPVALDLGLTAALEWLTEDFRNRSGIDCRLHAGARDVVLGESEATALFRIAQESLTNILKHAGATEVRLSLRMAKGRVRLEVRDNGIGFSPAAPTAAPTYGLVGIRERAAMLGASVDIRSAPGNGTRVIVRLPLSNATTGQAMGAQHS